MNEQAHERRRGEPQPRRGCGEAGPAPPIAFGMSPQVPRPQTPRLCPVCPGPVCVWWCVCGGGGGGGGRTVPTAVLEPAQACCPAPVSVSLAARP